MQRIIPIFALREKVEHHRKQENSNIAKNKIYSEKKNTFSSNKTIDFEKTWIRDFHRVFLKDHRKQSLSAKF